MTGGSGAGLAQQALVTAIVAACAVRAAWTLMPATWRRAVAILLRRLPLLAGSTTLQAASRPAGSGCACNGCDQAKAAPPTTAAAGKVIRIVPRTPTPR